jgi:hypothetical protein
MRTASGSRSAAWARGACLRDSVRLSDPVWLGRAERTRSGRLALTIPGKRRAGRLEPGAPSARITSAWVTDTYRRGLSFPRLGRSLTLL